MNSDDTTSDDPTPEQIEEWQAEAAAEATGEPAPKRTNLLDPEIARKAREGRERYWEERRRRRDAGEQEPTPKRRRRAALPERAPRPAEPAPPPTEPAEEGEMLRWFAYSDGLLQGVAALIDDGIARVRSSGYNVPSSLQRARDLLGQLLPGGAS